MKIYKLSLALPIIAISLAANAEITLDAQNNVSYVAGKSTLSINADGSASINGTELKKCDGTGAKVTKAKLGTVTCDEGFVVLNDKRGNSLSRFSSYAMVSDAKGNTERKLYDETLAKLGSPTTGASVYSQSQATTVEQTKTVTVEKLAPPQGYLNQPRIEAAKVDERIYTPKLGVMAEKTPAITKKNTPADAKNDRAIAKVEKEARRAPAGSTVPMEPITKEPVVVNTEISPAVVSTQTTTTIAAPTPSASKAGAQAGTVVQTQTQTVPVTEPAAGAVVTEKKEEEAK